MAPPSKKQKTAHDSTATTPLNAEDRLKFAKAIQGFADTLAKIEPLFAQIKTYDSDKLRDMDLKIESKHKQYVDLTEKLEQTYKNKQIELKQQFDEFKLAQCDALLEEFGRRVITNEEYQTLVETIQSHTETFETTVADLRKELETKYEQGKQALKTNLELQFKAEKAEIEAVNKQQIEEIRVLQAVNRQNLNELQEQRQLTKEVAMAAAKGQTSVNVGKQ